MRTRLQTARDVSREDDDWPKNHGQESVTLTYKYSTYCRPMLEKLDHFADMFDGLLERMKSV